MQNGFVPEGCLYGTAENTEYIRSEAGLRLAAVTGRILEAVAVRCGRNLDLIVDLGAVTGVIPKGQTVYTEGEEIKDIAVISRVGKAVCFTVDGFAGENGRRTAMLSRAQAQKNCVEGYLSYLQSGDVIKCRVTHTEKFGAFVDVGCGVPALLPVDRISVSRISSASDRLRAGDDLRCVVNRVERSPLRISLSLRELLGTWEENASCFSAGQTVRGVVRGVEPYGVFIELAPNLSGLSEYRDDVLPGDEVAVFIKSMDPAKMKIKLVVVGKTGRAAPRPLRYFVPEQLCHVYSFIYSTKDSTKLIRTDF